MKKDYDGPLYAPWSAVVAGKKQWKTTMQEGQKLNQKRVLKPLLVALFDKLPLSAFVWKDIPKNAEWIDDLGLFLHQKDSFWSLYLHPDQSIIELILVNINLSLVLPMKEC